MPRCVSPDRTGNKIRYFKSLVTFTSNSEFVKVRVKYIRVGRLCLKCDGTRAETRFRLSAKRMSPFKSVGGVSSVDYWQPRCAH